MGIIRDQDPQRKIPRTFASPAYAMKLEAGLYGLFRDILVETDEIRDGKVVREKSGRIGPIALVRPAKEGEQVIAQTFDMEKNEVIYLTPIDPETGK